MGKRDAALELLYSGLDPISIAKRQNVSVKTILSYLNEMIGSGRLRRSDVLFSVDRERRKKPRTTDDALIVKQYGSAAHAFGDMYEDIRVVEVTLHVRIRKSLQEEFGKNEDGWWRKGLPVNVRKKLVERREEDDDPAPHAYEYTDIVDLANILDRNWNLIAQKVMGNLHDKRTTLSDLHSLNRIRRKVMHPVRSTLPAEDDFEFTRQMRRRFQIE